MSTQYYYSHQGKGSRLHQQGVTLLEVIIALAISMLLLAAVIQMVVNSNQTFRVQAALSRVQENGQFAMQYMAQNIHNADYWGCLEDTTWVVNRLNSSGSGYNVTYYGFTSGLSGTANATGGGLVAGTDTITLRGATPASGLNRVIAPFPTSTLSDITTNPSSNFSSGTIVLVSDCMQGDIFQVTNGSASSGSLSHITGVGSPGNANANLSKVYGSDAAVYLPYTNTFSIQTGANSLPALFLTTASGSQELVPNIENLQILYGVDSDNDGTANQYVRANQVTNMNTVVSVRLYLVVMSQDNNLLAQPQSYTLNGTTVTPTDRRIHKVYTTTINLRNRQA